MHRLSSFHATTRVRAREGLDVLAEKVVGPVCQLVANLQKTQVMIRLQSGRAQEFHRRSFSMSFTITPRTGRLLKR